MEGIEFFKITSGNVRPSHIAHDIGANPNGEIFFQNGKPIGGIVKHNIVAIDPQAGLRPPMYLKKIPVARIH